MEVITDMEQGSMEWHALRRCKVTGTKLGDVMGTPLARVQLISELIAEEATEQSKIIRATEEMERGTSEEAFALKAFESRTGKTITQAAMCVSDELGWLALSPDGLIADKKGAYTEAVEVKSPDSKTAIFYRLANLIPSEELGLAKGRLPFLGVPQDYKWQCVQYFLVNEQLQKLHFVVYDARFIEDDAKLTIVTLDRDNEVLQAAIQEAKEALVLFRANWENWKEIVLPAAF